MPVVPRTSAPISDFLGPGSLRWPAALPPDVKISEASRVSGVSARSLRHYEEAGLIIPGRLDNGFRDYCQSTIDRVLVIRSLLGSGIPVRLARKVLPAPTDGTGAGDGEVDAEFLVEVRLYRDRLAARIAALSDQRRALESYLRQAGRASR
ncbi:MerR family transcriptional regulator [Flexivirga meconopsidis]|uniref:MerR family transcriptional regulator n=1 Tax=Flexivirga meconopsidis TaxID=2977121 RepID=UPI003CC66B56